MTRILGIDPGSRITGYGIIESTGNHSTHIIHGTIQTQGRELPEKLSIIFNEMSNLLNDYQPDEIAIEKLFMHRNADSALKLGQARGAAIAACTVKNIGVFEYTPNQVKQAVVGKGHAEKQQVQHMIKVLLCLDKVPVTDAADALAIALCHAHSRQGLKRMNEVMGIRRGRLR